MSKLPPEVRLQIARNSKDSVWKIEELLKVIKIKVEVREASEMTKTSENNKLSQASGNSRPRNQTPTANSLVSQQGESFKIKCVFCQNEHYSASRDVVKDTAQRRNILEAIKDVLTVCDLVTRRRNTEIRKHAVTAVSGIVNRFVRCVTKKNRNQRKLLPK